MSHSNFAEQPATKDVNVILKIARGEVGVSKYVPITHFNSATILESHNGMIFSVIKLSGVPFDTEKTDVLNQHKRTWHRALSALDERFAIMTTLNRRRENIDLAGEFSNDFAREVNDAYHQQFQHASMYANDIYLVVIYKGLSTGKIGKGMSFLNKLSDRAVKSSRELRRQRNIKSLQDTIFQLMTSLAPFGPRLLGENDQELGYSESLSYLSLLVNAGEALQFKSMTAASPLDRTLATALQAKTIYPCGNLSQYITAKRIFFGDYIQFQGATKTDTRFAAIVTIKRYGTASASIMLDPLLHLDCEFICTNSFAIESKAEADKIMTRQISKRLNADDPSVTQTIALNDARDQVASDRINLGYHHNTLMLIDNSLTALEQHVANAIKCYMDAGIVAVRETLGQEAAFWAQIPTNTKYIARSSLISSQNFVDFSPFHNYRTGYRDGNHLGSALTLIETPSKTPLFLNLHARGAKDNPSPGHTTLIGGNGSGKTVTMCFLDAQLNRYDGNTFVFDRNRGMEIYIRACRGYYAVLSPDFSDSVQFNPLQLEDTPNNRKFCREWLIQLVRRDDGVEIEDEAVEQLSGCVDYAFDQLSFEHRNLSNATKLLPNNFQCWSRLRRWLRGEKSKPDGEYAYLFDNDTDALSMQTKMGFDMTHFLDNESAEVLAAVTMYLFHRLELSLTGQLVSVFLDEGWQYLNNPYWQNKLKRWLPTLRKLNCHIVFATQSPKSVVESSISHVILDNSATNIYFSNPQAKREHYIDGFNLTEAEYACIKENEPQSRLFLYKQGHESALGKLNLTNLNDLLAIMSGTQASVELLTQIRAKVGNDPQAWMPIFQQRRRSI